MKVGDLVKPTFDNVKGIVGIIVEACDTPDWVQAKSRVWRVSWLDGGAWCSGSLCHENNMEVISESK